jgi:hypothetical protein
MDATGRSNPEGEVPGANPNDALAGSGARRSVGDPLHPRAGRTGRGFPLVLTHGWPSAFIEMLPLVSLLTDPAGHGIDGPAFDLVIPSLPGYAFRRGRRRRIIATSPGSGAIWTPITPSMRDYFDNRWHGVALGPDDFVHVPTAIAVFDPFVSEGKASPRVGGADLRRPAVDADAEGRALRRGGRSIASESHQRARAPRQTPADVHTAGARRRPPPDSK